MTCTSSNDAMTHDPSVTAVIRNNEHQTIDTASYTPYGPIIIRSDSEFASQGWPGEGTEENPYVISGLNITSSSTCINISSTNVYFEIRDCLISSPEQSISNGIIFDTVTHGTVNKCVIELHKDGINLLESPYCTLINNTISDNSQIGICLWLSEFCTLTNNTFNGDGVVIYGSSLDDYIHDMSENKVNNKPLGYFKSINSTIIEGDQYGQIILANCSEITVRNGVFIDGSVGIQLGFNTNCVLINNTANENQYGIFLRSSTSCTLTNNTASNNAYAGFYLFVASSCTLMNNTATNNEQYGFYLLGDSNSCTLMNNTASGNACGFMLNFANSCTLSNNTAKENQYGIYLCYCNGNLLFFNRLFDNTQSNGYDDGDSNNWDNGLHGNFWDDYDGIGVYHVPGQAGSVDNHPYVFGSFEDTIPPIINNPADIQYEYETTGHFITWSPYDSNPKRYVIYQNGTEVRSGTWNSTSETIIISVDGLEVGVYNYSLVVYDTTENSASDAVIVKVIDTATTTSTTTTITTTTTTTGTTETTTSDGVESIVLLVGSAGIIVIVVFGFYIIRRR